MRTAPRYSDHDRPGRPRAGRIAVVFLAVTALIAGGVMLLTGGDEGTQGPGATSEPGRHVANAATDPDTGLPSGTVVENGLQVGFPHTELGAAAMVVELNRAQIGFDYDIAVAATRVYADPSDMAVFEELATVAVQQRRRQLGLRATGDVLAPAAYAQTPIGYQLEAYDTDYYLVSVLSEVTTTDASGQMGSSLYVGQQFAAWTREDWTLVAPSDEDRRRLLTTPAPAPATPGTAAFDQAGWTSLIDHPDASDESS